MNQKEVADFMAFYAFHSSGHFQRERLPPQGWPSARITDEKPVYGSFTPVHAKHSTSFSLIDCVSVAVDRMQSNFEPMRKQVGSE